ncbi:FHA domain-containing protein [Mameliella sp. AT18]|uniref:FHA domain-containing protein n=1 Tax=Mameliella sp. AT18 TaxID=3028385 RepID=UPI0008411A55|nr:FHA domain-containing protein [Mameliella sp. AT18]MDD9728712.1 FHA domain-containing protein [Mameliella sp. AT18]ODM47114.1 hypothetical protein A9320_24220 [Ruegeria sp. PBVC088]
MQGIKNLIARRRPVSDPALDTPSQDAPARDPWDDLAGRMATEQDPRNCDIDSARAARNHVPRPERPQPSPRQEWAAPAAPDAVDLPPLDLDATASASPRIWDLEPEDTVAPAPPSSPGPESSALARSASAMGTEPQDAPRPSSQRVKTRLLGFHAEPAGPDPMAAPAASAPGAEPFFPIGWIVVIDGPGRGASFTLTAGLSTVGRDPDQTVTLDFGDSAISRDRHLAIAYDEDDNRSYIGHGGKANIVRLNDKPLLSTEELHDGDTIRIGKTLLRFVAFCGEGMSWAGPEDGAQDNG